MTSVAAWSCGEQHRCAVVVGGKGLLATLPITVIRASKEVYFLERRRKPGDGMARLTGCLQFFFHDQNTA
jgi:hypothetical protein